MTKLKTALFTLCSSLPMITMAHTGVGETSGMAYGFAHPFSGLDHLLAMLAVGLWASQMRGRLIWAIPVIFVVVMSLGGLVAFKAVPLPLVETGIMTSVCILGILIALSLRVSPWISCAIIGFFALFHGYAHGAEAQANVSQFSYLAGFCLSTALIHLIGLSIGLVGEQVKMEKVTRWAGASIAVAGVILFFA